MDLLQKEEENIRLLDLIIEILNNGKLQKKEPSLTNACKIFGVLDYLKMEDTFLLGEFLLLSQQKHLFILISKH